MLKGLVRDLLSRVRRSGAAQDPSPGTPLQRAMRILLDGDAASAYPMLQQVVRDSPRDPEAHAALGWACRELADHANAARHARDALALKADVYSAHLLLAMLALPGIQYLHILQRIHERMHPRTYVEIGVFKGKSIRFAGPATAAIGIDPKPQPAYELGPHCRIVAMTSDAYFATHDLTAELGSRPVELALIDGMHQCEYALRDFANLERHCGPGAMVLIHDGHPLDEVTSARERTTEFWTGDIWRAVLALRKYRPDLSVRTLASPPSGLTVVQGLDPQSRVLHERMDEIVADMLSMRFGVLADSKSAMLGMVPGDWPTVDALVAATAA